MSIAPVVSFLGGAGTVTGSRFLLETAAARVLVDAGQFQGVKRLRLRNWEPFPVDPRSIDAVVVTHAHLDHIGYLPALVARGLDAPVFVTENTAALAPIVLFDAARLQEEEAEYANRKGFSKHRPALPLFTQDDAAAALELLRPLPFSAREEIASGVTASLHPVAHILGSAAVTLTVDVASGRRRTLLVSGDVGRPAHPILREPPPAPDADVVLVESTYGDRTHEEEDVAVERLADVIRRTAGRGGTVVIPAFAVDRTEVVLLTVRRLVTEGRIPSLPVYADSPMALDVLDVYRDAIDGRDAEVRPELDIEGDPFDPGRLEVARTPQESMALNDQRFPSIIISASGMASGGRVLHHLANRLPSSRNSVVLVGFQAEGTRGRLLADGARAVKLLGRYVPVRAEVVDVGGFSVHADAGELVEWLRPARPPDIAFAVHGEPVAAAAFARRLDDDLGWHAVVAGDGERVRLD
ncbi:MAG TPA: MBL fold metallo-hydrolase [Acidimicrobiales bacterium]|nr:MBL fold metallo-hydrolase [Acidimicrobiales bacterium]